LQKPYPSLKKFANYCSNVVKDRFKEITAIHPMPASAIYVLIGQYGKI
jgi:hypothetical protein